MHKQKSIIGGLILILVGSCILLAQTVPALGGLLDFGRQWPLFIIGLGGLFLIGALVGSPELAIPGSIITGLGLIFYYQTLTANWSSWAYMWALIPGFVGVGMFITGTLDKTRAEIRPEGGRLILISGALFLAFALFFNLTWDVMRFWPLLLIGVGLWLLYQNRRSRKTS
jgi:hypothetical protein